MQLNAYRRAAIAFQASVPLQHAHFQRPSRSYSSATSCARLPSNAEPATLYLVATPIGHTQDITRRAFDILSTADVIAAEDTRVTGALLSTLGIARSNGTASRLLSCHEHNIRTRIPDLVSRLRDGQSVALVSDAGTPCLSDPGAALAAAAAAVPGVRVSPLPGACAAVAAIAASGFEAASFTLSFFLPRSGSARKRALNSVALIESAVVLYEAPHRLRTTLADLSDMPQTSQRKLVVARELTKRYEEILRFNTITDAAKHFQTVEPRGEFTLVLDAPKQQQHKERRETLQEFDDATVDVVALVDHLIGEGVAPSSIARAVAASSDVPKKVVYTYAGIAKRSYEQRKELS